WKRGDYLVRSLVKLGRTKEAVHEAETLAKEKYNNPALLVLAHAASGGARDALAAMQRPGPVRAGVKYLYQDPDLGPLLRSDPFRSFREKYPEPKPDTKKD